MVYGRYIYTYYHRCPPSDDGSPWKTSPGELDITGVDELPVPLGAPWGPLLRDRRELPYNHLQCGDPQL